MRTVSQQKNKNKSSTPQKTNQPMQGEGATKSFSSLFPCSKDMATGLMNLEIQLERKTIAQR